MLTVAQIELIRRKVLVDGMSQREAAEELGHSRKTIAKALAQPLAPKYELKQPRKKPKLDPVRPLIDAWLEEDRRRPRKQRHTAMRIYQRLCADYEFDGSYPVVSRYVAQWKQQQGLSAEVFMPLVFTPGQEAQVDWGEATVILCGVEQKLQFFCLKCCYSKRLFVRAYRRATLESFLDGHVQAFAHLGGVPLRLAYDNLKTAVIRVGRGRERQLHRRFQELRSWCLFDSRFCNPAKGNEKGHVENLVKHTQRSFLTPLPAVATLEELNEKLLRDCLAELDRPERDGRSRRELWKEEQQHLLALPPQPFPACVERPVRIDKLSLARFDNCWYSVPVRWAHRRGQAKGFVDRVEIFCEHQCVAVHPRSTLPEQFVLDARHYLPLLAKKPGSLDNARPFQGEPFGPDFTLLRRELEYRYGASGTRQFLRVLLLFLEHPEERVRAAVALCVRRRAFHEQEVLHALRNEPLPEGAEGVAVPSSGAPRKLDLSHRPELAGVSEGVRPLGLYDQLLRGAAPAAAVSDDSVGAPAAPAAPAAATDTAPRDVPGAHLSVPSCSLKESEAT